MGAPARRGDAVPIYLDVTLLVVLLLLYAPRLTGLPLHEWLGIALGVPLLVHILLSWPWVSRGTVRLVTHAGARARINYLLNWVLFILVVLEIASGVVISQAALPSLGLRTINDESWRALHNLALNWTMLALGLHVAMNWARLAAGARRHLWSSPRDAKGTPA